MARCAYEEPAVEIVQLEGDIAGTLSDWGCKKQTGGGVLPDECEDDCPFDGGK